MLLQALSRRPVERLVVASSMSIYGEGLYRSTDQSEVNADERSIEQLRNGEWELHGSSGDVLQPVPTPETKQPALSSIYALNKYAQERMCLITGKAYGIPTVALRFFNVFGPRQALSNPYTGVLAIFAARLLNDRPPMVFEDGLQRRDFVHVHDVARACALALETEHTDEVFNVGLRPEPHNPIRRQRSGAGDGPAAYRTGDHGEISRGRYPPLLRRHGQEPHAPWLRAARPFRSRPERAGAIFGGPDRR